jgi:leader peptidase (prepilin peptidase) / N-methyltransferase
MTMNWRDRLQHYGITPAEVAICAVLALGLGLAIGFYSDGVAAAFSGVLSFAMLVIIVTDSRRMLIPDVLSLPLIPIGLVAAISVLPGPRFEVLMDHAVAAALAAAALYVVRWAYFRFRGVVGMGLGDIKLAAAAGSWVGLDLLPMTLLFASCAALAATLFRSRFNPQARVNANSAVPFGSFIAAAFLASWTLLVVSK